MTNISRIAQIKSLLESAPNDSFCLYALGLEYTATKNLTEAQHYFEQCRKIHPEYLPNYYHLAKLYEALDDIPKATLAYEEGMELAKSQADKHTFNELRSALEEMIF